MIKTRISICLFLTLSISAFFSFAQQKESILLSKHTFTAESNEIGSVHLSSNQAVRFKLKGVNARLFRISNNTLSIKPKYIRPGVKWYDLDIQARTSSGTIKESFRIVNDQFIKNRVIAHRGAWKNTGASENSISALQHAIRLGCQGSEFDIHMSADSVLVVNHDPAIQGIKIDAAQSSQLLSLKLSNGENMPTLEAYIREGLKQNNTKLILEIKPTLNRERAVALTKRVAELVKRMKAQAWTDYISFDYAICQELIRLDPYARVAYLNGDKSPEALAADKLWGLDYHFNVFKKNGNWIPEAKQKGLTINAWTVNEPEMLKWFLDKKIDFITTNEPELLLKMVKEIN